MLILYSLKPISEIENSFDKHVEECSKVRVFNIFFSKGLSRERYFGERKKNRFWLSFTAPNQIISGTLRVMNGEIIEYDDFTTIKLKYKIPNSLKIKIAVSYTVLFFVLFAIEWFRFDSYSRRLVLALAFLFMIVAAYCLITLFCFLLDCFVCKGKQKKTLLIDYLKRNII